MKAMYNGGYVGDIHSKESLARFYDSLTTKEKELVSASIEWTRLSAKGEAFAIPPDIRTKWEDMTDRFYSWQYKIYNGILQMVFSEALKEKKDAKEVTEEETENELFRREAPEARLEEGTTNCEGAERI